MGLNHCPLKIEGTIRPLLGLLEAELTATVTVIYAKGDILYLFDNSVRDELGACGSSLQCTDEDYKDCAMCKNDIVASVEVGIKTMFLTKKLIESSTSEVTGCASAGTGGVCKTGVVTDDTCWTDKTLCGIGKLYECFLLLLRTCNHPTDTFSHGLRRKYL